MNAGLRGPIIVLASVALGISGGCGSTRQATVRTESAPVPTVMGETPRQSSSTPVTTGAPPADALAPCTDVPVLVPDVDGNLDRFANPDEEVVAVLLTYGAEHGETFAGFWVDRGRGGTLVLAFTDDPEAHRMAVLDRGPSPDDIELITPRPPIEDPRPLRERVDVAVDVVQARFSEAELRSISDAFFADGPPTYVRSGSVDVRRNRVSIGVVDPTTGQLSDLARRLPSDAACVDITSSPTPPTGPLDVIPDNVDQTLLSCAGGVTFPRSALTLRTPAKASEHPAALELLAVMADPPPNTAFEDIDDVPPASGWYVLSIGDEMALFGHGDETQLITAFIERIDDRWNYTGWSKLCDLRVALPEGLGTVDVGLDPDHRRPGPDDTDIHLLVTERACTSGRAMGDRLRGPELVETPAAVLIAFAAVSLVGGHTCPGNPSQSVTITLDAPLGDRPLLNGLHHPPSPIE